MPPITQESSLKKPSRPKQDFWLVQAVVSVLSGLIGFLIQANVFPKTSSAIVDGWPFLLIAFGIACGIVWLATLATSSKNATRDD